MADEFSYQDKANVLKAMAHPSRLKIIDALSEGERCVCRCATVGADMSTVSKHLSVMRAAGIVDDLERGSRSSTGCGARAS